MASSTSQCQAHHTDTRHIQGALLQVATWSSSCCCISSAGFRCCSKPLMAACARQKHSTELMHSGTQGLLALSGCHLKTPQLQHHISRQRRVHQLRV